MKKLYALFVWVFSLLILTACDVPQQTHGIDQCLRRELFQQCLKALPAGPVSTHYNDWDEVVSECNNVSVYQAWMHLKNIKEECR